MNTQRLYMNVYRAGFYHRQGKPRHTNLHAGDFFLSHERAVECIEHDKGYITTVSFDMPLPEGCTITENPDGSVPTPLHETRGNPLALAPWHSSAEWPPVLTAGLMCPYQRAGWEDGESLDTSEGDARPYTATDVLRNRAEGIERLVRMTKQQQQGSYMPAWAGTALAGSRVGTQRMPAPSKSEFMKSNGIG